MSHARCPENERLLQAFSEAVQELLLFTEQHFSAIVNGEPDPERYELLIHMAGEKRQGAKYAYLNHIEEHGCERRAHDALLELNAKLARKKADRPERRKRSDPQNQLRRRLSDLGA